MSATTETNPTSGQVLESRRIERERLIDRAVREIAHERAFPDVKPIDLLCRARSPEATWTRFWFLPDVQKRFSRLSHEGQQRTSTS